ncbi:hypothetical protein ACFWIB_04345 [Streptomyces sp. NPDC127051]|uniref:hypothetical protein n=1 Tax=Streptomyces sp. NPDC127051 TaxID=3347119 RepID=UPI003653B707
MTTLNLTGYPTDKDRLAWDRDFPLQVPRDLMSFFGRTGENWLQSPPGRVVTQQLWPALGGGQTSYFWSPPSPTVAIDLTGLTRREKSSLARFLDEFCRQYPDTGELRAFVQAIVAEDAAAQTDPHAPRLFDV